MITYEKLLAKYPQIAEKDRAAVDAQIGLSRLLPDNRFKEPKHADQVRMMWIMHALEAPPVDLTKAITPGNPNAEYVHPWSTTEHGRQLMKHAF